MNFLWSLGGGGEKKKPELLGPNNVLATPSQQSFKSMSTAFRKGVHYNMKVVLRGDVMTGKSVLFDRLQGEEFTETYKSTPQIQVTNIPWQYKESNDVVKIEIWDVVDKAHNNTTRKSEGIKLEHTPTTAMDSPKSPSIPEDASDALALDASTVNVYRNAHAVLFLFDVTKPWTFDYVNRSLATVPCSVSVLVLGNFCDKSGDRKVTTEEIHATLYEHNTRRIEEGAIKPNLLRYAEISLQSGMGLKYIYDYFGVPFLQLMIETLKKQLEIKSHEAIDLLSELDKQENVPDNMKRRRGQDNFDQPAEPRLARQHEEMKETWEQIFDENADHESFLNSPTPFVKSQLSSPSLEPVSIPEHSSLALDIHPTPVTTDMMESESLQDDWFQDSKDPFQLPFTVSQNRANSDNEYEGNPMVAGDEDVESVEYFNDQTHTHVDRIASLSVVSDSEEEEEEKQQPVFKSELEDVWAVSKKTTDISTNALESESEEEDVMQRNYLDSVGRSMSNESIRVDSPFSFGVYEEIEGSGDNPWSLDGSSGQNKYDRPRDYFQRVF
ncbi:hypothetical protein BDF14DRAFT_1755803 [Spinellus fusiger]|nr:hypothetical protein BDF14DRAFT_1755803 [Spinellus fusiger]